ncbi:hypothetical protein MPS_4039 [Mycobacterium pseudoshottsii JCM 15466]|nr:hypothetical protein MPS_4039 [Mycobacterium pseudoshottsii JCM 15466]
MVHSTDRRKAQWPRTLRCAATVVLLLYQAQLEPTALSVCAMLLPAA